MTDRPSAEELIARGKHFAEQGDWEGAIAEFEAALRVDPQNADACLQIGIVHLSQGNLDSAMTNFTLALRLTPTLADAYFYRGQARALGKLWDEALS